MKRTPEAFEAEFFEALQAEDELGLVIRAHIFIEAGINQFLECAAANPSALKKLDLEYSQKATLAVLLGLHPRYEAPLLAMGSLRNAFAHRLDAAITKDRVEALYKAFSGEDKTIIQVTHEKVRARLPNAGVGKFRTLTPQEKFIFIAVALRALIAVAIKQFKEGK